MRVAKRDDAADAADALLAEGTATAAPLADDEHFFAPPDGPPPPMDFDGGDDFAPPPPMVNEAAAGDVADGEASPAAAAAAPPKKKKIGGMNPMAAARAAKKAELAAHGDEQVAEAVRRASIPLSEEERAAAAEEARLLAQHAKNKTKHLRRSLSRNKSFSKKRMMKGRSRASMRVRSAISPGSSSLSPQILSEDDGDEDEDVVDEIDVSLAAHRGGSITMKGSAAAVGGNSGGGGNSDGTDGTGGGTASAAPSVKPKPIAAAPLAKPSLPMSFARPEVENVTPNVSLYSSVRSDSPTTHRQQQERRAPQPLSSLEKARASAGREMMNPLAAALGGGEAQGPPSAGDNPEPAEEKGICGGCTIT